MEGNKKKRFNHIRIAVVIVFLLIYLVVNFVTLRGEYLSIKGIDEQYLEIFRTNQQYKFTVAVVNFIAIYIIVYLTNKGIKRGLKVFFDSEKKTMPKLPNKTFAFVISIITTLIVTGIFTEKYMLFANSAYFGVNNDPVFNYDIGFYIFNQPLIEALLIYAIIVFIVVTLYVIAYYIVALNVYFNGIDSEILKKNNFIKQIAFNIIVVAILIAGLIFVTTHNILLENMITITDEEHTSLVGAGLTDATIKLWGNRILSVIVIIAVVRALNSVKTLKFKKMFMSLMSIPIYLVGLFIVMTAFQLIYVNQNNLEKEKKYIEYNIDYTRKAYDVSVDTKEIENYDTITYEQVSDNSEIMQNIPIISKDVTLTTLSNAQDNEGFYSYNNTALGMYRINGKKMLMYLTPREIISDSNRMASNKIFRYTHGYGVVATSPSSVDKNGYTEYLQTAFDEYNSSLYITEPRIYFGLECNSPIIVNSDYGNEYDYPTGISDYEENIYNGKAGIKLGFLDRFIMGIRSGEMQIAITGYLNGDSKIIADRNIIQRAKTLLPYIEYDEHPYLIITSEGRLVWVIDGYTTSDKYPYAQYVSMKKADGTSKKINYIRNSVKVFVDAYDGTTTFYITDKTDPIILAYRNIYPSLFKEIDSTTYADYSKHFIYPKTLYDIQAEILEKYHVTNVEVLYRADDIWKTATQNFNTSSATKLEKMNSYYTVLNTVDSSESYLGLVIPYTKNGKQNMNSYLVGACDINGKNRLRLYKFSADTSVAGPVQLSSQIEQDETISAEIESISVTGTRLSKDMIIVPINNTLLYVEPVYQTMLNDKYQVPVLKKVIVASGNKVTIGNNFDEALSKLLSESAIDLEIIDMENVDELIDAIIKANNNLKESEKSSNMEMIGKDIARLQELIDRLEKLRKKELQNGKEIKIPIIDDIISE